MTILKLVLFILWTLFVLAIMGYILRKLYRALKVFHGHTSADMAERILDTAEQIGVDTAGVRKLLEVTIGETVHDLGVIEARTYGRSDIEYSAQVNRVKGEQQIVLIIKDEAIRHSFVDFSERKDEYRIPIRSGAAHALLSILESNEEQFLRTAADYESRIEMEQTIERDPLAKAKNNLLRWFAFVPLKSFGPIDRISTRVPVTGRKQIQYDLDIGAYIGKEFDEIILVLRFEMKYRKTGAPGRLHYILYYPFGAQGRENLRRILRDGTA